MEFVSYDIESNDFRRAGAASRAIKEHLKRIGAEADAIRRTMIAAYEAEMNVVIHSVGGRLEASLSGDRIDVNVIDEGPGIPDIELAMKEGYSTASAEARALGFGAGMGLPNIKRSSDRLRITSRVGEGTRVSFSVYLRPEVTCAAPAISLYASADRCRDCRACLTACPTEALRVRGGRPMVLEHLCIDCTECIGACTTGALTVRDALSAVEDVKDPQTVTLVMPQALLAGFGPDYPPAQTLSALGRLGFAGVRTIEPFEDALREAAGVAGEDAAGPVILPMCPAIINLVQLKFPSLVGALAAFESPWEALEAATAGERSACVVSCPGQRSTLTEEAAAAQEPGCEAAPVDCLLPETLRSPVMKELTGPASGADAEPGDRAPAAAAAPAPRPAGADAGGILLVSGVRHVMAVLEEFENGLLEDVTAIEAYACEGGCFGSPLLFEDHHVARRRWERGRAAAAEVEQAAGTGATRAAGSGATRAGVAAAAVARRRPYAARPGIRLDPDMSKAIQKLGRLQILTRSLPGRDCGACGAPTCAALAEDVVMERAAVELCPYLAPNAPNAADAPEKEVAES
jgi:anti-sigma regulatory factor (Ser/Thr protein kinase)/Na+-translocating ferredoxin:NAD+ oxidoreductase RNF subunit RnfB